MLISCLRCSQPFLTPHWRHATYQPALIHFLLVFPRKQLKDSSSFKTPAWLLTKTKRREHISPVLASLHWLPGTFRIDFKVLLLTYKALNGQGPGYIANSLTNYTPARTLRSSDTGLLQVNRSRHKKIGDAAFVNYAPKLWNTLPINIREANTLDTFKKNLFTKAFYSFYLALFISLYRNLHYFCYFSVKLF